ncbi:MAG: peptidoglycan-associated lipoprotein, partial [Flavobacteriales bacterium]
KEKNKELKAYKLNNIYFGFDSYAIVPKEKTKVGELKKILDEDPNVSVVIKAHTDARGNDDYNLLLSMRRAQSIQKYLQKQGIDASRFQIAWVGEKEPLVNCTNKECGEEDHALNRRAEVVFVNGATANKE